MATKVSFIIIAQNQYSKVASAVQRSTRQMQTQFSKLRSKLKSMNVDFQAFNKKLKEVGKSMRSLGSSLSMKLTAPIIAFGTAAVVASGKIEKMGVSFSAMLKSQEKGQQLMRDLSEFSAGTPFQLEGIAAATKQLLGFQVAQEDMIPTLKMLGDISAGADVPLTDMAAIFGKIKAKGKAMTEELLQMSDRGVPIIAELGKQYNLTGQQVFDLASEGKLSFEVIEKALRSMVSKTKNEQGIFYQQMQKISETAPGLWSTLKDNVFLLFAALGDVIMQVFGVKDGMKGLISGIQTLTTKIRKFAEEQPKITKYIAFAVLFAAVLGPVIFALGAIVSILPILSAGVGVLGSAIAIATGPVGILIATLYAAWKVGGYLANFLRKFPNLWDTVGATVYAVIHPIETLKNAWIAITTLGDKLSAKLIDMGGVWAYLGEYLNIILHPLDALKIAFTEIISFAQNLGSALSNLAGGALDKLAGLFGIKLSGDISNKTSSTTDVNVNLNAPKGVVNNIKTKSRSRSSRMNVGVNMQESLVGG